MSTFTCCFSGHRIIAREDAFTLMDDLRSTLDIFIQGGITRFIAGGALGFDTMAAKEVLSLRDIYPEVRLHLILPCRDQAKLWHKAAIAEYERILAAADSHEFLFDRYVEGCMQVRNRIMVNNSDVLLAYYKNRAGGTRKTLEYAKEKGIRILCLPIKEEPTWNV